MLDTDEMFPPPSGRGKGGECWGEQQLFPIYDPFEESGGSLELFPRLLKMLHSQVELFECLLNAGWLS